MTRACLVVLALAVVALADDKPKPESPAEKLEAIKKAHKEAQDTYFKAVEALPNTPEGRKQDAKLSEAFDRAQGERFLAAVELAKADPKSDFALTALEWVLTIPRSYYLSAGLPALELVAEHHAINPKVGKIVAWVGHYLPDEGVKANVPAMALIKAVAEKNPDRTARGQAMMALAWQAMGRFAVAEYKRTPDVDKLAAEAEKAFEAIVKDYADCPSLRREGDRTLGERAKENLYELRHLRIGKTAPEIEAEGVDGVMFKLSDYRGKVTVLVFWASWCGPCMAMVPHERKMAERHKDKPFALVGVNGDGDRDKAKAVMAKEKMTWPSFWNGPKDGHGPISRAWNLSGWPTVYVLDAKGTIRFKNIFREELDKAVDELLQEMADGKKDK